MRRGRAAGRWVPRRLAGLAAIALGWALAHAPKAAAEELDVDVLLTQPGVQLLVVSHYAPGCEACAKAAGVWKSLRQAFFDRGLRLAVISAADASGQCAQPPWEVDRVVCPASANTAKPSPELSLWSWRGQLVAHGTRPGEIEAAVRGWFARPASVAVRVVGAETPAALGQKVSAELAKTGKLAPMAAPEAAAFLERAEAALDARRADGLTECAGAAITQAVAEVRVIPYLGGPRLDLLLLSPSPACVLASGSVGFAGHRDDEAVQAAVGRLLGALHAEVKGPPALAAEPRVDSVWGGDMVLVPAGDSWMGSDEGEIDQRPRRRVYLDSFWIDVHEVTAAAYDVCATKHGCTPAGTTPGCTSHVAGKENHPINCLTWEQAKKFCEFAEKRLPSEAEWEKAARGPGGVPVLDAWEAPTSATAPVDALHASVSPYGAHGMSDNVWEWVADWYDRDGYALMQSTNPHGPAGGTERVIRGGSLGHIVRGDLRTTYRMHFVPSLAGVAVGVRCARSEHP